MKNSNKKGFTLVELVVVIAIIGVLAAILVPSMMGYVKKARLKTANGNAKTAYNAAAEALADAETQGYQITTLTASGTRTNVITGSVDLPSTYNEAYVRAVMINALASNGKDAGEAVAIGNTGVGDVWVARWHKTESDAIVGQYPEAPATVDKCPGFTDNAPAKKAGTTK